MAEQLEFKISSALKSIIGRDLITDDFIAVFELVKNSYDAYANKVVITFEDNRIIISDDGKGMSLDDLKNKWLFVAYSAKNAGVEDEDIKDVKDYRDKIKAKRYYAGAKGIGRFSCDRLGQTLKLVSRKIDSDLIEQIEIDWERFETDAEKEFEEITVDHTTLQSSKNLKFQKHGTTLEVTNLQASWKREKIKQLKHSLEKLINPFGSLDNRKEQENFSIEIVCERELKADKLEKLKRDKINGPVENFVFETLNIKTTQVITEINSKFINTSLIDRGNPIYEIQEPNKNYWLLEDVKFHLFFLNRKAKQNFSLQMGLQPVEFGSIFLFKNGFRVYPFGNEGDDSLELDFRKQQGYARRLGTRDLIGRIEIFSNSEEFTEISSRDGGLVKTDGYEQLLEAFLEKSLKRLEKYVVDIQWAYKEDENLRNDKDRDDIALLETVGSKTRIANLIGKLADNKDVEIISYNKDFLNIINEKIEELIPETFGVLSKLAEKTNDLSFQERIAEAEHKYREALREKAETEEKLREAEAAKAAAEQREREANELLEIERQKNTYLQATRKTLSPDAEGLVHNIKINTVRIDEIVTKLINRVHDGKLKDKDLLENLKKIKFCSDKALKVSKLITRANFRKNRNKETINIPKYVEQYFSLYSEIYERNKLEFEVIDESNSFFEEISILELSIVFDNLVSNSEKWGARKVLIEMRTLENEALEIIFADNGKGVLEKHLKNPEQLFELGVTETDGSGIGLSTVKDALKNMNAEIDFIGNGLKLKGANFRIIFEK